MTAWSNVGMVGIGSVYGYGPDYPRCSMGFHIKGLIVKNCAVTAKGRCTGFYNIGCTRYYNYGCTWFYNCGCTWYSVWLCRVHWQPGLTDYSESPLVGVYPPSNCLLSTTFLSFLHFMCVEFGGFYFNMIPNGVGSLGKQKGTLYQIVATNTLVSH